MKVYLIGGLGADKRVFRHIQLPASYEMVYLDWLNPGKNESLASFAGRMSEQINIQEPFFVIGLSLGGMIATEIVRLYPHGKLILISSISHPDHLPVYYRWLQRAGMHKKIPVNVLKKATYLKRYFTRESEEDKNIIRSMIQDADPVFIRWALGAVLEWKGGNEIQGAIHIHGSGDGLLPLKYTRPTHVISRGSHLMIMEKANEINQVLSKALLLSACLF